MVTQNTRPRRATAVEAVKRATQTLSGKGADKKIASAKSTTVSKRKMASISVPLSESGNESSELSEVDGEEEGDDDNEEVQEQEMESEMDLSESEIEADITSDYEEGGKAKRKRANTTTGKSKGPRAKKPKKGVAAPKKPRKLGIMKGATKGRAGGKQVGSKEELTINEDNKIFNNVKDSESDLQTVAEEWVATYQDDSALAMAQLINSIFRSSACNATIDEVQVMDHDNITDTLDEIQESLKKEAMPSYPLVSRSVSLRRFRRQHSEWIEKLFTCVSEADILYDDIMMETLMAWISAMSSSAIRSIRHTSTYTVLVILEQINRLGKDNRKEIESAEASRDVEKRKGSAASKIRLQDLETKVKQEKEMKKQLNYFHQEFLDTVFIHRYRDSDPLIRAECIGELGRWMKTYPDQYLSPKYFRYFGWMLSDQSEKVRLVSIKSLDALYTRHEYSGHLQDFTERFHDRMMEMATIDIDVQVRVAAISTLTHIDQQDALDEEAADSLSLHIFDTEPKVRSTTAVFVKGRIDELLKEIEEDEEDSEVKKLRWKHTAEMFSRLGKCLDGSPQAERQAMNDTLILRDSAVSRINIAVSALWNVDEGLQDWKPLLELLLYDHSEQQNQTKGGRRKPNTREIAAGQAPPNEDYRLQAEEESILLEALSFIVGHLKMQAKNGAVEVEGAAYAEITREIIPILSKLFGKYKTESSRIIEILTLARNISLDSYIEYQQISAFETLWDDVIDQFQRHTEPALLTCAVNTMVALSLLTALNNVNTSKMTFLQESILRLLKEKAIDDESAEDGRHSLSTCISKLKHLVQYHDLSDELTSNKVEDDEGNNQDEETIWFVLMRQIKHGLGGQDVEASIISDSISILSLSIMWIFRRIINSIEGEEKQAEVEAFCNQRSALMNTLSDLIRNDLNQVGTNVKKSAFQHLVDLYILFASVPQLKGNADQGEERAEPSSISILRVKCDADAQEGLAIFVRAEIRRFAFKNAEETRNNTQVTNTQGAEADDNPVIINNSTLSLKVLQYHMDFVSGLSHYIGAIRLGIIHAKYSAPLLSRFGRFGAAYDACLRVLVETIRIVGIQENRPDQACSIIIDSLWQAHHLYCDDQDANGEANLINLSKMLSSSLVVRGAQLTILKSVNGDSIKKMHSKGIRMTLEKLIKNNDEEYQLRTLGFFKVLSQLLVSVAPREAVTIKKDMDNLIGEYGIDVPLTSKVWDALRQYEKRLVTIASKSESVKKHVETNKAKKDRPKVRPFKVAASARKDEDEDITMNEESLLDVSGAGDESREEYHIDLTLGGEEQEEVDDDNDDDDDGEGDDVELDEADADAEFSEEE